MDSQSGEGVSPLDLAADQGLRKPRIVDVSRDMEAIFPMADGPLAPRPSSSSRAIVPIMSSESGRPAGPWRAARAFGFLSAIVLAVLASVFAVQHGLTNRAPYSVSVGYPRNSSPPTATRLRPTQTAVPQPILSTPPIVIAQNDAAMPASRPTPALPTPHIVHPLKSGALRLARLHDDTACGRTGRSDYAWCMRPRLIDADRRLRSAYDHAAEAGVDRQILIFYRRQWLRLLDQASADPMYVTAGYLRIAQQLDNARSEARMDN